MNILIYNWRDPRHPLAGGAEQMVFEHAKFWKSKGVNITWFASSFKNAKNQETIDGIQIIRKGSHYTVFIWAFFYFINRRKNNTDLIVDCFHFFPYFSHFYAKKIPKLAILQEVAGNLWFDNLPWLLAYIGSRIEPFILQFYKSVTFITGSQSAKDELLKLGFGQGNVHVINHGINRIKISKTLKEREATLIFLGRVSRDKGIEDALNAVSELIRKKTTIKLLIVGRSESTEYDNKVKKLIASLGIAKYCHWYGFVSQYEKFSLLSKAWLLIHPSKKEGWGLNVIEANSVGTPAVGYSVGGLTDSIVANKTGLLVKPDVNSLVEGIGKLLTSPKLLNSLSKNAVSWSQNFTWESAGKKSWELIQKEIKR